MFCMKKTIEQIQNCTGCGACENICPHRAISMRENSEGFLYPQISAEKCIQCGLCYTRCPSEHAAYENAADPACYAAMASDELRRDSSSGAAFPMLAEYVLESGGYVCGAAWGRGNAVEHIIISDAAELYRLKGSKYVQSKIGDVYRQIRGLLQEGKFVLFSGTPCQVAGLKAYLGRAYDKLLTVDIVCHGAPSPAVYRKYIRGLVQEADEEVLHTNFRDKVDGWKSAHTITTTTSAAVYSYAAKQDAYMQAFLCNMSLRKSCAQCPFAKLPRQGDITLGDFWGIKRYSRRLNDTKGVSLVLVNSPQGKRYAEILRERAKVFEEVPLKYGIKGNACLVRSSVPHADREGFFARLPHMTLKRNVEVTKGNRYDCAILNFWYCSNYGAMLTCYALQELLIGLGKSARVINYMPPRTLKRFKNSLSQRFAERYLKLTELCRNKDELKKLNEQADAFLAGSDQIWRHSYSSRNGGHIFHLDFVRSCRKKIACAASFGTDHFEGDAEVTQLTKFYLQQFDSISVREADGVRICRDTFGTEAVHILDPVFLAPVSAWDAILRNADRTDNGFIATYVLDQSPRVTGAIAEAKRHFAGAPVVEMGPGASKKGEKISVEDWLYNVKNCSLLVTDSFHGTCFAIIFNKPFICLLNSSKGSSRFTSLCRMFGLEDRILIPGQSDLAGLLAREIDYAEVNRRWEQEAARSRQWIADALAAPGKGENVSYDLLDTLITDYMARKSRSLLPAFLRRLICRIGNHFRKRRLRRGKA